MVLIERVLLGALLVALCATVNHTASIPSATSSPSTTTESTTQETTESFSTTTSDEAQKEANSSRTENARSLDLDISKYTSTDFHNKVYDQETFPDGEKPLSHEISKVHTTFRTSFTSQTIHDFDKLELTTPSSKLFDDRHKALQNEIKKGLEVEEENLTQVEKPVEPIIKHNKTNLDFVRYTNIVADDDVRNKTSIHRNYETEKGLNLSYESVYNQSEGGVDTFKVHSAKAPLLNNKIENDKAINISKRGFTKLIGQTGNSTDGPQSNLLPLLETSTTQEQTQQENNIYPVLVPIPLTTTSTTEGSDTKLYEMTENDGEFASTTENAFEANNTLDEKFYEMTESISTTDNPVELSPETTTTITTTSIDVGTISVLNTASIDDEMELERGTTTTVVASTIEPTQTDASLEDATTTTGTTESSTTISGTTTEPMSMAITTENANNTNVEEATASTTENDNLTISTDVTTEIVTTLSLALTTEATTILSSIDKQTNELDAITTTESTPESTTVSVIISTISSVTYNSNAILKEDNDTSSQTVSPINDIKKDKDKVLTPEIDLDDLTGEVTEDDYIDILNRKVKPTMEPKTEKPQEIVTESSVPGDTTTTEIHSTNKPIDEVTADSTEAESKPSSDDGTSSGTIIAIVLSTVGAVCLILLAILLFVVRRRQKRFNYGQRCTPVSLDAYSMDNISVYNSVRRKAAMRGSKRSYGNPAFDDDTSVSHPVNFQAIVRFVNNTEDIKAEFDEIPQVNAKMNELPDGCDTKNRYANVIPLPESRVYLTQLDDDSTSDYINANYVTGPKGVRGYYIACQAPLHNTVNDFWRMIWEQQSRVILMLTHLFENGVEKCVDYLPPSEVVDCHRLFGDFQVTLKKREVKDKYIISSLQLKNMVSNSWREVTHLWYSGWPEKGVPDEENSIIAFLIEARSYIKLIQSVEPKENGITSTTSNGRGNPTDSSPVVVHCSPGTGRTGTVIACDIAIREFELRRIVDIPRIVYRIRRDRASSVQTKDQYHFIYKVINLYATKLTGGALDSI